MTTERRLDTSGLRASTATAIELTQVGEKMSSLRPTRLTSTLLERPGVLLSLFLVTGLGLGGTLVHLASPASPTLRDGMTAPVCNRPLDEGE